MPHTPRFVHHDLELLNPSFDSPLVDVLTELEHLRRLQLAGDTPAPLFFQLKGIFHLLESLGSARIEGNHTTLADYVESRVDGEIQGTDHLREISNIEHAMAYIDEVVEPGVPLQSTSSESYTRLPCHRLNVRVIALLGHTAKKVFVSLNQRTCPQSIFMSLATCLSWSDSSTGQTHRSMT